MPDIRPFRPFAYGGKFRKELRRLVCPPYDVISPAERTGLLRRHPLNFVRLESPEGEAPERYRSAAALWRDWVRRGVLAREGRSGVVVYEARFRSALDGRRLARRGFFASLRTEPWGRGVHPHEKTLPTPKADRLELFKALRAQTSPIQLMAQDEDGRVRAWVDARARGRPWLQFRDEAGVTHRLWRCAAAGDVLEIRRLLAERPCAIADGHHRYETARAYARLGRGAKSPASQRVMGLFSSAGDPGLEVLPTHRAVPWSKRRFVNLQEWGRLAPLPGPKPIRDLVLGRRPKGAMEVGVYRGGRYFLFTFAEVPPVLQGTPSARLATAALHAGPLKGLGKEDFVFTRRMEDATAAARAGKGWAFFLAPHTVAEVMEVATAGQVMPPKSTYFYPKIPSGLVAQSLQGRL